MKLLGRIGNGIGIMLLSLLGGSTLQWGEGRYLLYVAPFVVLSVVVRPASGLYKAAASLPCRACPRFDVHWRCHGPLIRATAPH